MSTFRERQDLAVQLENLKLLETIRSKVQIIRLYAHPELGRVLTINGELQHAEAWQCLYHEPLVHLPSSFIPVLRNVLILGGGSLFAAREALKYPTVVSVDQIDHDEAVIGVMRRHYRHAKSVMSDQRFSLTIADARSALSGSNKSYDLIVNDCFDLSLERAESGLSAYRSLERLLSPVGLCSDVIYRHIFNRSTVRRSLKMLSGAMHTAFSLITVPEYPGVLHLHTIWGRNRRLSQRSARVSNRVQLSAKGERGILKLEYYDPLHRELFLYLPPYLRRVIERDS